MHLSQNRELIPPKMQTVWRWPAVANFALGGAASGYYLLSLLTTILQGDAARLSEPAAYEVLAPILAGLGFMILTLEAGRPSRSIYLLRHLRRSWMSRETLAALLFIPLSMIDWLLPQTVLWPLAAIGAGGLIISQGFILYRSRAVTAWNVPLIPPLFVTSGFASGVGLIFMTAAVSGVMLDRVVISVGLGCALLDLAVWLLYLRRAEGAFRKATRVLRRPMALIQIVGIGRLLPTLILLLFLTGSEVESWRSIIGLVGLALFAGGVSQKVGIILGAGYLRAIVFGPTSGKPQAVRP